MSKEKKQQQQKQYLANLKIEEENYLLSSNLRDNDYENKLSFQEDQIDIDNKFHDSNDQIENQVNIKSKKEMMKEKREKKKMQVQFKKSIEESSSAQEKTQTVVKEDKLEKQKIKNRESAQLSRDRKKQQESIMQQDLQFLTEENKSLQSLLNQQYTCEQCGYLNQPESSKEQLNIHIQNNTDSNPISNFYGNQSPLNEYNYNQNTTRDYHSVYKELTSPTLPVQSINSNNTGNLQNQEYVRTSSSYSPSYFGFGKGMWSTALVVFLLYLVLLFSGGKEQSTLDTAFRQLQVQTGPYQSLIEHCKGLTKDQLLECLLSQLQALQESEQGIGINNGQPQSSNDKQVNEDTNEKQQSNSSQSQKNILSQETALLKEGQNINNEQNQDPISQKFLDFCKQYIQIERQNQEERQYYQSISKQLEALQQEKMRQIEQLKRTYCINDVVTKAQIQRNQEKGFQDNQESNNQSEEISDLPFYSAERTGHSLHNSVERGQAQSKEESELPQHLQINSQEKIFNEIKENDLIFDSEISSFIQTQTNKQSYSQNQEDSRLKQNLEDETNKIFLEGSQEEIDYFFNNQDEREMELEEKDAKKNSLASDTLFPSYQQSDHQEINLFQEFSSKPPLMRQFNKRNGQNWIKKDTSEFFGPQNFLGDQVFSEKGVDPTQLLEFQLKAAHQESQNLGFFNQTAEQEDRLQSFPSFADNLSQFANETDIIQEENNLFGLKENQNIDYSMIDQPNSFQRDCHIQSIACQYSFPNQIDQHHSSSANFSSVNLQSIQHGQPQIISLLFSPSLINSNLQQSDNKMDSHLPHFECQVLDQSICSHQTD